MNIPLEVLKGDSKLFGTPTAVQYYGCIDNLSFGKNEDSGYDTTYTPGSISYDFESSKENYNDSESTNRTHSTPRKRQISECSSGFNPPYNILEPKSEPYPITPNKRNCRLNPCKTSKKLDFTGHQIHSLDCQISELQPVKQVRPLRVLQNNSGLKEVVLRKCGKKCDLIDNLQRYIPPLELVLQYLPPKDISNFIKVSPVWKNAWEMGATSKMQHEYKIYLEGLRQNQENLDTEDVTDVRIHRICRIHIADRQTPPPSPPRSPRTLRFRKFLKSGLSDSRTQVPCVKCTLPAKVTEEKTGEQWVLCTNESCSYKFCRHCGCKPHPNKECFQYDLNGPSPSKRTKRPDVIGSKNSRKSLRRL